MPTWMSSGPSPKRASCASTVHSGRCSAHMTCSRSTDADLARLSALTSQPVSATMLSSAPSISHIVSGERSPVIVTAPKSSSSSPARRAHDRLERQVDTVQREERRLRAGLVTKWQQLR